MASSSAPRRKDPNEKIRSVVQGRIRKRRRKLRLSEKDLGFEIGKDEVTIKRWEGTAEPHTMPKLHEARVLADRLGVSLDWLTGNRASAVGDAASVTAWAERERRDVTKRIDQLVADLTQARASLIEEARIERAASRGLAQEGAQQHG